jgi:hypothetical protein
MVQAFVAARRDTKLAPAAVTARADATLAIYVSFDPPPPAVGMAMTDAHGAFQLACDQPQVVLVARASQPVGDGFVYYAWAGVANAGTKPSEMNNANQLTR